MPENPEPGANDSVDRSAAPAVPLLRSSRASRERLEQREAPPWLRSRSDRALGGVCGGLAARLGWDSGLVRAMAVLGCFIGGLTLVAYPLALFLLPLEPRRAGAEPQVPRSPRVDQALFAVGVGLVLVGLVLFSIVDRFAYRPLAPSIGAVWPALLVAMALLRSRRGAAVRPLSRPRKERVVCGVASGYARQSGTDPNLVRLVFAVLAIWSLGIVAYLYFVLASFLPEEPPAS